MVVIVKSMTTATKYRTEESECQIESCRIQMLGHPKCKRCKILLHEGKKKEFKCRCNQFHMILGDNGLCIGCVKKI